ncbi:MAG TPA: ATP-binding protein [Flavobacterium sp.]|nr:ATP-binding protein [Flavobacterium sp.]
MSIYNLIINDKEQIELSEVFLSEDNRIALQQLIKEHKYVETLRNYKLPVNNKLLLHGSSGCGKTTTAKAIAHALGKPLMILNLSNIVSSRIGETSQNLKAVFDKANKDNAVLFLDEFDQIGKARGNDDKDVGEMRRLVNTLIQLIDYYPEKSLLICATNHVSIIDTAILRRFQVSVGYELPDQAQLDSYYTSLLENFPAELKSIKRSYGVSFAQAKDDAYTQIKAKIIAELEASEINTKENGPHSN